MKFKYKKYAPGILRPVIPFDIFIVKFDLLKEEIELIERRDKKLRIEH